MRTTDEPVIVTQRGRAAAVRVSYDAYEGLLATHDETSYPDWKKRLALERKESGEGKGVELEAFHRRAKKA